MKLDPPDLVFALEWAQRKLNETNETKTKLTQENDHLRSMIEQLIDQLDHYSMGDLWTQDDMILVKDLKQQLEEIGSL